MWIVPSVGSSRPARASRNWPRRARCVRSPLMIASDGFLTREFFYYSCRFSPDFPTDGDELLGRILSLNAGRSLEEGLQIRIGRLAGKHPELHALLAESGVLAELPIAAAKAELVTGLARGEGAGALRPESAADALLQQMVVSTFTVA